MAALTDTTGTPKFLELQPDWSRPVGLRVAWETLIQGNREAGEQRACTRSKPRYGIRYTRRGVGSKDFALQRGRAMQETNAAVVVPLWPKWLVSTAFAAHSVTFGASVTYPAFKVGSWIYALQGSDACFRKITAIASATITLSATGSDFFPVGFTWATFVAGARIYPCVLGMRDSNAFAYDLRRVDRVNTEIVIDEL